MINQRDYATNNSQGSHRQIQMGFLNKKQSQRHAQILQQIMEKNLRKQSRSFHDLDFNKNTNDSGKKMLDASRLRREMKDNSSEKNSVSNAKQRSLAMKNILRNLNSQSQENQDVSQRNNLNNPKSKYIKNSEQNQPEAGKEQEKPVVNYSFNIISYLVQIVLAYGLTIGIDYLYQLGTFPYYQLILIGALALSINPFYLSNGLVLTAAAIAIVNNYIGMSILTYPSILICYLATLTFNQKFKIKLLFVLALVVYILYGFVFLPALYQAFNAQSKIAYYYLFPLFMFIFRTIGKLIYWVIGHSTITYLQLPFFMTGLQYGTILSLNTYQIQFWYLIVFFTLEIIIEKTQVMPYVFERIVNSCTKKNKSKKKNDQKEEQEKEKTANVHKKRKGLLVQQSSGYNSIHSLHIVCLVYIYSYLPLYYFPYTSTASLSLYVNESYKPLLVWILGSVYEVMCIVLERKRKDLLLIGFKQTGILAIIVRSVMLILGFWFFYLGLGVGNYIASLSTTV